MDRANIWPAFFEGFRLIGRKPIAVLMWAVVYVGITAIPVILSFLVGGGDLASLSQRLEAWDPASGDPAPSLAGPLNGLIQIFSLVLSIFTWALLQVALFRAILRPEDRRWFYLDFRADELRVAVVGIVLWLLAVVALVAVMLVIALPMGVAIGLSAAGDGGMGGAILAGVVGGLAILAALLALLYFYVRLGFAVPLTVAEGKINIFEGWAFTRGYAGQLFGFALVQILFNIALVLGVVIVGVLLFAVGAVALGLQAASGASALQTFTTLGPMMIVFLLLYVLLAYVLNLLVVAPWTRIYQIIAEKRGLTGVEVFD